MGDSIDRRGYFEVDDEEEVVDLEAVVPVPSL
jgi:hypothetical protein